MTYISCTTQNRTVVSIEYVYTSNFTGVVSLFPKETGLVPLKATCHTPRNHTPSPGNEGRGFGEESACVGCEGATLCLSDVPLGPTTVSLDHFHHVCSVKPLPILAEGSVLFSKVPIFQE